MCWDFPRLWNIPQSVRHSSFPSRIFILAGEDTSCKYEKVTSTKDVGNGIEVEQRRNVEGYSIVEGPHRKDMGHCPGE